MANPKHLEILQKGVATWNSMRKQSPDVTPDLTGANLSGALLVGPEPINLTGADLRAADMSKANLAGLFGGANLSGANLSGANLGVDFSGANLSGANLTEGNLIEADLNGADLTEADLTRANLARANLSGAHLSRANLGNANLTGANLRLADLTRADLTGAQLSNANLAGANLRLADLTWADLTGANLSDASLTEVNLRDAKGVQGRIAGSVPSIRETGSGGGGETEVAIERILCPVDFSEVSVKAYRYAQSIACRYHAKLILQHVVESWRHQSCYCQVETLISNTRDQLRHFADKYGGVQPECVVEESVAADEPILSLARARAISLIVMGTHGCRGFDHLVLGSATERVLRHAPCPVLAIHGQRPDESGNSPGADSVQFRQILCCVDFSAYSQRTLDHALSVARAYGAEVTVLHVLDNISAESPDAEKETNATLGKLQKLVAPSAVASTKIHMDVRLGEAYREILKFAAERRSDLIVTGVRGRNSLDLAVFGSTTYRVIQHYPGSVLTVPI